nr:hypothetical protein [Marinicella sp. W31]MDC2877010.1 hypothetical protein [Marinicella sp. W31]
MKSAMLCAVAIAAAAVPAVAELPKFQMTTEIPESITTPDKVETSIGNLEFFDGVPSEQTVQTLYDNLDSMRGVQTFLAGYPAASAYALYDGPKAIGADRPNKIQIFKEMMDLENIATDG